MHPELATSAALPLASARTWYPVQPVVGPPADRAVPPGLYMHGAVAGIAEATGTGPRHRPVVPAGATADFGTYFNAFPGAQWHAGVGSEVVRLRVRVDAGAVLTVRASDALGRMQAVERRLLQPGAPERVDVAIDGGADSGLVWFDLQAGPEPVVLLEAAWEVAEEPRPGGLVVGSPTVGRAADIAANLARIAAAPALAAVVERVVVVDQAAAPIASALATAAAGGPPVSVLRQPNLGGSGGYSRVMHEAAASPTAQSVLLVDDDVVVEPAALLRAFEYARRSVAADIVALQMLDAARPSVLEAGAERIDDRDFWWAPADGTLPGTDVAARPVRELPGLHRWAPADFAPWWGALIPVEAVRAIGYAMPFFVKWDDAEYALRARAAGYRTVSLLGAAVWHESWRAKDDSRTWPAFFHARNRLVAALLHGSRRVRTGVLLANLALELKQLLALHVFAVEVRQDGLRAVLAGPESLETAGTADLARLLGRAAAAPEQHRMPLADGEATPPTRRRAPAAAPRGGGLVLWTAVLLLRHLVVPARRRATRLPAGRGTWWELPWFDDVLAPTADGDGYFRLVRDPRRFRLALAASIALHVRLWFAWPRLRRRYRAAAGALSAPEAWMERFRGTA